MQNAHDNINAAMGQFVSTFAPQAPEKSLIDTFLANFEEASINFVMGQALGPLSEILKPLGEAADATQSAITGGLELIKDQAKEANKL
jgi:hypothetical protein